MSKLPRRRIPRIESESESESEPSVSGSSSSSESSVSGSSTVSEREPSVSGTSEEEGSTTETEEEAEYEPLALTQARAPAAEEEETKAEGTRKKYTRKAYVRGAKVTRQNKKEVSTDDLLFRVPILQEQEAKLQSQLERIKSQDPVDAEELLNLQSQLDKTENEINLIDDELISRNVKPSRFVPGRKITPGILKRIESGEISKNVLNARIEALEDEFALLGELLEEQERMYNRGEIKDKDWTEFLDFYDEAQEDISKEEDLIEDFFEKQRKQEKKEAGEEVSESEEEAEEEEKKLPREYFEQAERAYERALGSESTMQAKRGKESIAAISRQFGNLGTMTAEEEKRLEERLRAAEELHRARRPEAFKGRKISSRIPENIPVAAPTREQRFARFLEEENIPSQRRSIAQSSEFIPAQEREQIEYAVNPLVARPKGKILTRM